MHFHAYVYILFVYRAVCDDVSTRSNETNHLNLESGMFDHEAMTREMVVSGSSHVQRLHSQPVSERRDLQPVR